uniref:Uncharacterized protein n=1 Tax=candidate division WOR-3 bacterium TaxID=2052148 RepID=A0A7C4TDM6_UNCW3
MPILQAILITILLSQSSTDFNNEWTDKGTVFAIEETGVNIGGVWFAFAPGIKSTNEVFDLTAETIIQPPFEALITFVYTQDRVDPYVKKIKIIKSVSTQTEAEK